jgi:hypothetical protein
MKGIYLTEEGKKELEKEIDKNREFAKEIEAKIAVFVDYFTQNGVKNWLSGRNIMLKEILSSATILPVEESWDEIRLLDIIDSSGTGNLTKAKYPNGVIIKPIMKTKYAD